MSIRNMAVLTMIAAILFITGCATPGAKDADPVVVEDRSAASSTGDAARTSGLQGGPGFQGNPLDDPSSPLSKRVIYFDFNRSDIRPEYRDIIKAHAGYLAEHRSVRVRLEGHADERGSREYNLALGERRALTIRRMQLLLGVSRGQLNTVSFGEERPIAAGHDEASWRLNRRVEIVY